MGLSLERKLSVEITEIREAAKGLQDMIENKLKFAIFKATHCKKSALRSIMLLITSATIYPFLTLLDGNNNGVCISSIYGRNDSRIFSKPIVKGKSLVNLSQEELESLNEALGEQYE